MLLNQLKLPNYLLNKSTTAIARSQRQPFHLVKPSPWPFITAFSVFFLMIQLLSFFHNWVVLNNSLRNIIIIFFFFTSIILWLMDISDEAVYGGYHTKNVEKNIRFGFILFLVSEAMFFFGFFWAFFHFALSPSIWIGSIWPPKGVNAINAWGLPFLNTILLVTSGVFLSWSYRAFLSKNTETLNALFFTILLGVFFIFFQYCEYAYFSSFNINDSVYGTTFYILTGCHGLHVILGTLGLMIIFYRLKNSLLLIESHLSFEFASWYWHFVDVIWMFVFLFVYIWGA